MRPKLIALIAFVARGAAVVGAALITSTGTAAPSRVAGGSPGAQALLLAEAAKVPTQDIARMTLGSPSPDDIENGVPDRGDNWLYIDAVAPSKASAVVSAWEGGLIGSAFADDAPAQGLDGLTGMTVTVHDSIGQVIDQQAWFIPPADQAPLPPVTSDLSAAEAGLLARFKGGAQQTGAQLKSVAFRLIPRLSADITISTNAGPTDVVGSLFQRLTPLIGDGSNLDAIVVRIDDAQGQAIVVDARNARTRSSETWVRSGLESEYPYAGWTQ